MNRLPVSLELRERKILLFLGLIAVIHLYVFIGTFPFFNNVDEQSHLDLVVRYSQADIPRSLDPYSLEACHYIVIYGTSEYVSTKPVTEPPWTVPWQDIQGQMLGKELAYRKAQNHEVSQPPLYYSVMSVWWRLIGLHFQDGTRLYLLRLFNIIPVLALMLLGWRIAVRLFPDNWFIRVAVPAFIALMPQTTFYSLNNDVFSPLLFGAVFLSWLKFQDAEVPDPRQSFWLGLALAGTFLTKLSNLPLLVVMAVFIGWKIYRLARAGKLLAAQPSLGILAATALLPMAAWMAWCKMRFGDLTGSAQKIQFLGWTGKPFAEWFHHPIFTPKGFWTFISENFSTLWQGEFLWRLKPLALPGVDRFYVFMTLVLLLVALIVLWKFRQTLTSQQQSAAIFGFSCLVAMFAFFALLSVKYDFHDCFNPSRAHPYFTSGRLMLGMLIPFLLLLALGLDRLLDKVPGLKFPVLAIVLAFMAASEIMVDWRIFPNPYNWFHM